MTREGFLVGMGAGSMWLLTLLAIERAIERAAEKICKAIRETQGGE